MLAVDFGKIPYARLCLLCRDANFIFQVVLAVPLPSAHSSLLVHLIIQNGGQNIVEVQGRNISKQVIGEARLGKLLLDLAVWQSLLFARSSPISQIHRSLGPKSREMNKPDTVLYIYIYVFFFLEARVFEGITGENETRRVGVFYSLRTHLFHLCL